MSRSKISAAYPRAYLELLKEILLDPTQEIVLPMPDLKAARNFLLDFNSFKHATILEGWDQPDNDGRLGIGLLNVGIARVTSRVQKEPPALIVYQKDHARHALVIEQALEKLREERNG